MLLRVPTPTLVQGPVPLGRQSLPVPGRGSTGPRHRMSGDTILAECPALLRLTRHTARARQQTGGLMVSLPSTGEVWQPLSAAPVLIVACVNTPASGQAGFQTGASIYPSVQNLMLAACALGLGTVLTTLHRRRKARIHEILGIPDHIESAAIIPLGWPDRAYGPNRRPPLAQFVMHDRWHG